MRTRSRAPAPYVILLVLALIGGGCRSTSPTPAVTTVAPAAATQTAATPAPAGVSATATSGPAALLPAAEVVAGWDFAGDGAQGWRAGNDLSAFHSGPDGIETTATGGDPYMTGPVTSVDAVEAPHIEVHMRSTRGSDAQLFWEVEGKSFNEAASKHFDVTADGDWHTYRLDLKGHPQWQGRITRLRLDPANLAGGDIALAYIHLLGPLPPAIQVDALGAERALVPAGQPAALRAVIQNRGDIAAQAVQLELALPSGLSLGNSPAAAAGETAAVAAQVTLDGVEPDRPVTLTWALSGAAGVYPLALRTGTTTLRRATVIVEGEGAGELSAGNDTVRVRFGRQPYGYGAGTVEWKGDDGGWRSVGRLRSLGRIVYRDAAGAEQEALLFADKGASTAEGLSFEAHYTDADGLTWTSHVSFRPEMGKPAIALSYDLSADRPAQLLAWAGPEYLPGEGAYGAAHDSALFPGLEFLLKDENSSSTAFADPPGNLRYVPHPNKITIPLMAVTKDGVTTGLSWDPLQAWDGAHDRPAALFAAANSWELQDNHLLRLFVPGMTAGLVENHDRADKPYALAAGQRLTLSARLFAAQAGDPLAPLALWLADHPLPDPPAPPRTLADAAALCLDNYTKVTWVEGQGWRYALHDPWGPGSDPAVALHLWLATLDPKTPATTRNAWRAMAQQTLHQPPVGGQPNPWYYQPTLLLHMAAAPDAYTKILNDARDLAGRQAGDGSWRFTPTQTPRRLGQAGDSSNGYTAASAFPVLYAARLTGDAGLATAGLKALGYLEGQTLRPEGAQTWELDLHVPDLLASAWVTQAFVEGYRLTGETRYLDLAQRWAMSGLPFIYLWNPADRPVMRYGAVPVYGASNYTYPWFGRPVMWNGLDYAIGVQALDEELRVAGIAPRLDWRRLAEGITTAAVQMQSTDPAYLGMYPDAWDVVGGSEAYTWWLTPTYLAQNLLLLAGNAGAETHTQAVDAGGQRLRISTPGAVREATATAQTISLRVRYTAGETSALLISPLSKAPAMVSVGGRNVAAATVWPPSGPAWGFERGLLVVRVPFATEEETVSITLGK